MKVRTRFAPSPTGYLHLGGARTALYAWLFARHYGGQFVLRIEDTDLERSNEACAAAIIESMDWLGINYDEGPYYQTKRFDRYLEVANKMLDDGLAYKCYCPKERVDCLRDEQMAKKEKPKYDGLCRDLEPKNSNDPYVIRFKNPKTGSVVFHDAVYGEMIVSNDELDDLVIVRTDGSPTYNFTVVVDDMDMNITHVIRGADHISNTPRQINILKALGYQPPIYAHVPTILGEDGKKLSKRHGAAGVMDYRGDGILPEALLNYLIRLGWSHGDQEIFTVDDMKNLFDLDGLNKAPAALNPPKLLWLNQHFMKLTSKEKLAVELKWHFDRMNVDTSSGPKLSDVVSCQIDRSKTIKEIAEKSKIFYETFSQYDEVAVAKHLTTDTIKVFESILEKFNYIEIWKADLIHQAIIYVAEKLSIKLGNIAQPLRVAVTGGTVSPPIDVTLELIGKDKVIDRITKAIEFICGK